MDSLPLELLHYLISFLPLASLIAARDVNNTTWRSLAQTACLHPARKALLDLYLAAIIHPNFPGLAQAMQPHLHEFDRKAYITDLMSRGCVLPDLFELWILEWPSQAVHFWSWPGIPVDVTVEHENYSSWGNLLNDIPPIIDTIPVPKNDVASVGMSCQGLPLWGTRLWMGGGVVKLWLVVNANERMKDGKTDRLIWTHSYYANELEGEGPEHHLRVFYNTPFVADTLIEFLSLLDLTLWRVEQTLLGYRYEGVQ